MLLLCMYTKTENWITLLRSFKSEYGSSSNEESNWEHKPRLHTNFEPKNVTKDSSKLIETNLRFDLARFPSEPNS